MKYRSRFNFGHFGLVLLAMAWLLPAQAELQISGFGSIRLGQLIPSKNNPNLVEFYNDEGLSWRDETLFGLQFNADLTEDLSYTLQWLAQGLQDYKPEVSLGFLKYQLDPNHQIKFGRLAVPLFAQSDIQYIGYAHDYSRLPKAVYWRFDFETADGLAFEGKQTFGAVNFKYLLQLAEFKGNVFKGIVPGGVEMQLHQMKNYAFELGYQQWQWYVGGIITDTDGSKLDQQLIVGNLQQLIQNSNAPVSEQQRLYANLSFSKPAKYQFVGFRWQYADWRIEAERARYRIDHSADQLTQSKYLAISHRFNHFMLTIHQESASEDFTDFAYLTGVQHPFLQQLAQKFVQKINNIDYQMRVLSGRYDLQPGWALKADVFYGKHRNPDIDRFKGFSLGVDFVF